jgi:hypothetical protein
VVPVLVSVQDMGYGVMWKVGGEVIHHNCGIGRINEYQALFGSSRDDVGVVILKEGECDDLIVSF